MSEPHAHIYPHATGRAATTVEQHQEPQDLVFYAGWFCPFVQRAWIALEERNIPYQYKEVNPYKKEKHFIDINPKGLVPAIEYKGKALYESLILLEFFEDAFPAHAPHLLPADPLARAHARLWADHVAKQVVPGFMRTVMAQGAAAQRAALEELCGALRALADHVAGPYFLGEQFGLVDAALAPWVGRDYILAENRGYSRGAVGAAWEAYAEKLETRESVVKTQSDKEHYTAIYARYLRDEAQSEAAKATRAGRPF
ncbi:glutathione S-transferase C-terminal-like protein [Trametes elegans]|nr:glutathione S-transferase C-terminal-like protein [Trametes elegans]